jgi:hypothetical protein
MGHLTNPISRFKNRFHSKQILDFYEKKNSWVLLYENIPNGIFCDSKVKQEKLNKQPEKCRIRDNIINVDEHFLFFIFNRI